MPHLSLDGEGWRLTLDVADPATRRIAAAGGKVGVNVKVIQTPIQVLLIYFRTEYTKFSISLGILHIKYTRRHLNGFNVHAYGKVDGPISVPGAWQAQGFGEVRHARAAPTSVAYSKPPC